MLEEIMNKDPKAILLIKKKIYESLNTDLVYENRLDLQPVIDFVKKMNKFSKVKIKSNKHLVDFNINQDVINFDFKKDEIKINDKTYKMKKSYSGVIDLAKTIADITKDENNYDRVLNALEDGIRVGN